MRAIIKPVVRIKYKRVPTMTVSVVTIKHRTVSAIPTSIETTKHRTVRAMTRSVTMNHRLVNVIKKILTQQSNTEPLRVDCVR